jgi:hypothetical protein
MSAWTHRSVWNAHHYHAYRHYVARSASSFRGQTPDCADISITTIIDFAALYGLPLTFWDNAGVRYISKATRQSPKSMLHTRSWGTADDYLTAVRARINADSLLNRNTVPNPRGPEPGDIMASSSHAALVFGVRPGAGMHPRAYDDSVPIFPGDAEARLQLNQTEYIRTDMSSAITGPYVDYLNHRGFGKNKAELMYDANVQEMRAAGFDFRMYSGGVLDSWADWDGRGDPPR